MSDQLTCSHDKSVCRTVELDRGDDDRPICPHDPEVCPLELDYTTETCQYLRKRLCCIGKIAISSHHMYFPKKQYPAGLEKDFRELPEHQASLCSKEHDKFHHKERLYIIPEKPPPELMRSVIERSQYRGELKIEHNNWVE